MCVYVYVYTHISTYTHICLSFSLYVYIYIYIHMYVGARIIADLFTVSRELTTPYTTVYNPLI